MPQDDYASRGNSFKEEMEGQRGRDACKPTGRLPGRGKQDGQRDEMLSEVRTEDIKEDTRRGVSGGHSRPNPLRTPRVRSL